MRIIYASYLYPPGLFAYCCIHHFLRILLMTREASLKWLAGAVQQDLVVEEGGHGVIQPSAHSSPRGSGAVCAAAQLAQLKAFTLH